MKNNKKKDDLSVNIISAPGNIKDMSNVVGNAGKDGFCLYAGKRHAVGSVVKLEDGSEVVCTDNGSWQNRK